jgi:hypothetical protein
MSAFCPWPIENNVRPMIIWRAFDLICRGRHILLLRCVNIGAFGASCATTSFAYVYTDGPPCDGLV